MTIARWKTLSSRPVYKNKWTAVRETVTGVLHAARLRDTGAPDNAF